MKMSFLGINNTFHDETIRAGDYTTDSGIIYKVAFADEALEQWSHRYPGDPQLARSYYLAIVMYRKIYTQDAQQKAWTYMHVLTSRFGGTYFGKLEKADIARGFTEHYFANAQLCPTPLPSGVVVPAEVAPSATATPPRAAGSRVSTSSRRHAFSPRRFRPTSRCRHRLRRRRRSIKIKRPPISRRPLCFS